MSFERGTFDPKADPFPGSFYDKMGIPRELARSLGRFGAFVAETILPKEMRVQDLLANARLLNNPNAGGVTKIEQRYRSRIRSPLTAIRAFCVECSAYSPKEAWNCPNVECPLWPFHRGRNGLRVRK